ncbi:MAG: GNAT family N-acetyltransferase [Parvularculaceae bacterium]
MSRGRDFEFVRAGAADASELQRLWVMTFRDAYADVHTPENLNRYCEENYTLTKAQAVLSDPATECVIARQGGEPAGLMVLTHHECPARALDGGSSELKQVYVRAAHYGAGLGKALYDDALARIRASGRQWIWLIVSDLNTRAQAFYRKNALEPVGAGPVLHVGSDRLPSTVMAGRV